MIISIGIIRPTMMKQINRSHKKGISPRHKPEQQRNIQMIKKLNPEYGTWSGLLNKTNLGGMMIQRLYNGKWDSSFYAWKVTLTEVKNSWLGQQKDNFTTHSSEACAFLGGILRGEKRTLCPGGSSGGGHQFPQ